jgi:phosphopantothenoylcysteine synthetase/decarboxylase
MNVLITSGGTRIAIDRVRHISNMSRGTFGSELARCFLMRKEKDVDLTFLKAEGSRSPFLCEIDLAKQTTIEVLQSLTSVVSLYEERGWAYEELMFKTYNDYAMLLRNECVLKTIPNSSIPGPNIVILAAAVSDYGTKPLKGKVRSSASDMSIKLHKLPKLISKVKKWCPTAFLVGFKLMVDSTPDELVDAARESLKKNKCDLVVANDLRDIQNNDHKVALVYPNGDLFAISKDTLSRTGATSIAEWIMLKIVKAYKIFAGDLR